MKIRLYLILGCLLCYGNIKAQLTPVYTEPLAEYREAQRLYETGRFSSARIHFSNVIDDINHEHNTAYILTLQQAYYYKALCDDKLNLPEAETLYQYIIDNYEKNSTTQLCYWRLASIMFDRHQYDKVLSYLNDVDETLLSEDDMQEFNFKKGYANFTKKNYDEADKYLRRAAIINNDIGNEAAYYTGYIAYSRKHYNDALHYFNEIKNTPRYAGTVPYFMANIYYVNKSYDKVIELAEPLVDNQKLEYRAELRLLLGKAYYNEKQYTKARPLLKEYVDTKGKAGVEELYQLGVCEYYAEQYTQAISYLSNVILGNDSLTQNAYALLANCYMKTNDKQKARSAYAEAEKADFDKKIKENAAFNFAELSAELGYPDIAIKALNNFLKDYPSSSYTVQARELLIDLLMKGNDYKEALKVLTSVNELTPTMHKAYQRVAYGRAVEMLNDKDYTGAEKMFNVSLKNPINMTYVTGAYFYIAQVNYENKEYEKALSALDKYSQYVKELHVIPVEYSTIHAAYTYGYTYMKLQQYRNAEDAFIKCLSLSKSKTDENLRYDATLRAADCAFVLHDYERATEYYKSISDLQNDGIGSDYALYQSAIILGLQNENDDKIAALKTLIDTYKNSVYRDDALYECGVTYLNQGLYAQSLDYFSEVIDKYPNSPYIRRSYLKRGLVYANLNNEDKSREQYEYVARNYGKSGEAKEALTALQDLYVNKGDANGYINFLKTLPDAPVTDAQQDSILYLAAEAQFVKNDCDKAVWDLSTYLNKYPNGGFALQAHLYRAECLRSSKKYAEALPDYEWIAQTPANRFSEKAVLEAARITLYQTKDYHKAYNYYKRTKSYEELKSTQLEASQGMMYAAYSLNDSIHTAEAGEEVMANEQATPDDIIEAKYYTGMSYYKQNEVAKATPLLEEVAKKSSSEKGAEAHYYLATIKYTAGEYKTAQDMCFDIIKNQSSYDTWVTKTYILLADCYHKLGDNFQAKATLKSLIDNSDNKDLVKEAQDKYDVLQKEDVQNAPLLQRDTLSTDSLHK